MQSFAGLELGRDAIPDETTILNFRHLLERYELTKAVFATVAEHLGAQGTVAGRHDCHAGGMLAARRYADRGIDFDEEQDRQA